MLLPAPSAQDESRFAAKVLADLVGNQDGSRLYWSLIEPGLADEADLSYSGMDGVGAFSGYLSCDPERADQAESVFVNTLASVAKDLTDDEVARAANKLATRMTLSGEQPRGRMERLGRSWSYRKSYTPLDQDIDTLLAVRAADVLALLETHPLTPLATARLGPM